MEPCWKNEDWCRYDVAHWRVEEWPQWYGSLKAEQHRWRRQCAKQNRHTEWAKAEKEAEVTGVLMTPPSAARKAAKRHAARARKKSTGGGRSNEWR
eukprot:9274850-Karenia_brevis.AAC.1